MKYLYNWSIFVSELLDTYTLILKIEVQKFLSEKFDRLENTEVDLNELD